jgi:hypothetical protein
MIFDGSGAVGTMKEMLPKLQLIIQNKKKMRKKNKFKI